MTNQPQPDPQAESHSEKTSTYGPSTHDTDHYTEAQAQPATKSNWQKFLPPLLAFALVAALGAALLRPAAEGTGGGTQVGGEAPTFTLQSLDGVPVSLNDFRGRPVVLNFWASWCGPCREEAPLLRQLSERQSEGGLAVVGILFEERDLNSAREFIGEYGLAYPNLIDERLGTALDYGVSGIPETFFVDASGIIQHRDRGGLDKARLNAGLATIGVAPL